MSSMRELQKERSARWRKFDALEAEIERLRADYRRASMSNEDNWKAYKAVKQQRERLNAESERDEALALLKRMRDWVAERREKHLRDEEYYRGLADIANARKQQTKAHIYEIILERLLAQTGDA